MQKGPWLPHQGPSVLRPRNDREMDGLDLEVKLAPLDSCHERLPLVASVAQRSRIGRLGVSHHDPHALHGDFDAAARRAEGGLNPVSFGVAASLPAPCVMSRALEHGLSLLREIARGVSVGCVDDGSTRDDRRTSPWVDVRRARATPAWPGLCYFLTWQ